MNNNEELVANYEEDLEHGCTPPQVLQALRDLRDRCDRYILAEPGEYRRTEPEVRWSTANLRSRWRMSQALWRKVSPSPIEVAAPTSAPAAQTAAEPSDSQPPSQSSVQPAVATPVTEPAKVPEATPTSGRPVVKTSDVPPAKVAASNPLHEPPDFEVTHHAV